MPPPDKKRRPCRGGVPIHRLAGTRIEDQSTTASAEVVADAITVSVDAVFVNQPRCPKCDSQFVRQVES